MNGNAEDNTLFGQWLRDQKSKEHSQGKRVGLAWWQWLLILAANVAVLVTIAAVIWRLIGR